jgi:hypothetical protein
MDGLQLLEVRTARPPRGLPFDLLTGLEAILATAALVLFLRCAGPPYWWVLLATALPGLRFALSTDYRRRVLERWRDLWSECEAFAVRPDRLPWRAALVLIVLPAGLFYLGQTHPIMAGDSKPVALTAINLVCHGTTDLANYAEFYGELNHYNRPGELPYFFRRTPTGIHSSYPSGMVLFALPSAALGQLLGTNLAAMNGLNHLEKGIASWLAAACVGLFFLLALHLADARSAALVTVLLAVGSGVCSTVGQALWQHGGVIFWLLLVLLVEFRTWQRPAYPGLLLQAFAIGTMLACRLSSALLILPFGLWLLCRSPRRAVLLAVLSAAAHAPWAWYYYSVYGTPLGPSVGYFGGFILRFREVLVPILIAPDHGLLPYQPWIVLGLAPLLPAVRRRLPRLARVEVPPGWTLFCLAGIGLHLGLLMMWNCWWGGACWGSRLATEIVPLCALLCVRPIAILQTLSWGRAMILVLALASFFVHGTGVYLKADYRDVQPGLFDRRPRLPGSWTNFPFLSPFGSRDRSIEW